MPRGLKILLFVLGTAGVLSAGLVLAAGVALARGGLLVVKVHEKKPGGAHVVFAVPGGAACAALAFVPNRAFGRAAPELRRWLPAMEAALAELERTPDATLVEVEEKRKTVHVRVKSGGLVIDVDSPDETVHVAVPGAVASAALSRLKRLPVTSTHAWL